MEEYRLHFGIRLKLGTIKAYASDIIHMIDTLLAKSRFNAKEAEFIGYRLDNMMQEYGDFLQSETYVASGVNDAEDDADNTDQ